MYYNDETWVYLNGHFVQAGTANMSLYAQTAHYGYGAFEGIRSYTTAEGSRLFKAREHYLRLKMSCEQIRIPFAYEVDQLIAITEEQLSRNSLGNAYIRPLVYTGPNMSLSAPSEVQLFIAAWSWDAYLGHNLLRLCTSSYQRPNPRSTPIEAKACGHYTNSILASIEARERGFDEALLLDADGYVAEGPGANLFMEKDGRLYTPSRGNILPGITRQTVIELCHSAGIPCTEKQISPDELKQADSAFYCGTAAEVAGIARLDEYRFPLPWQQSLGKAIQELYAQRVRATQDTNTLTTGV